jgi:hypothetical protein
MDNIEPVKDSIALSVEKIIDLIRIVRNELIKDFLKDDNFSLYFQEQFNKDLSLVKREFLRRDLKELLISPVDLVHYAGLINQLRETNTASITERNNELFYRELDTIFKKYSF